MIVISVFAAVLSSVPKSPISERQAITGALCAYYQAIDTGVTSQIILPDITNIQNQCLYLIIKTSPTQLLINHHLVISELMRLTGYPAAFASRVCILANSLSLRFFKSTDAIVIGPPSVPVISCVIFSPYIFGSIFDSIHLRVSI